MVQSDHDHGNEIIAVGDLYKITKAVPKQWNMMKFILSGNYLTYFDENGNLKGRISISGCIIRRLTPNDCCNNNAKFAFGLYTTRSNRRCLLNAINEKERTYWISVLESQIHDYEDNVRHFLFINETVLGSSVVTRKSLMVNSWSRECRLVLTNYPRFMLIHEPTSVSPRCSLLDELMFAIEDPPMISLVDDDDENEFVIKYKAREIHLRDTKGTSNWHTLLKNLYASTCFEPIAAKEGAAQKLYVPQISAPKLIGVTYIGKMPSIQLLHYINMYNKYPQYINYGLIVNSNTFLTLSRFYHSLIQSISDAAIESNSSFNSQTANDSLLLSLREKTTRRQSHRRSDSVDEHENDDDWWGDDEMSYKPTFDVKFGFECSLSTSCPSPSHSRADSLMSVPSLCITGDRNKQGNDEVQLIPLQPSELIIQQLKHVLTYLGEIVVRFSLEIENKMPSVSTDQKIDMVQTFLQSVLSLSSAVQTFTTHHIQVSLQSKLLDFSAISTLADIAREADDALTHLNLLHQPKEKDKCKDKGNGNGSGRGSNSRDNFPADSQDLELQKGNSSNSPMRKNRSAKNEADAICTGAMAASVLVSFSVSDLVEATSEGFKKLTRKLDYYMSTCRSEYNLNDKYSKLDVDNDSDSDSFKHYLS